MAGLQLSLPLPVGIMLPQNKMEAPELHSAKQDPSEKGDSSQRSSMGHPRNNVQQKLLSNQEQTLDNLYTHPKWNTCTKAQSYSYPCCAGISQQDSRSNPQGQAKCLFYSPGPQSQYPKANNQEFIPFSKKRVGVDRAYPLKPVFHRKPHSTGEAGTDGDQNVSPRPPEPRKFSYNSFGSRNWVNSSVVGTVAASQEDRVMAKPNRTEWMQIQRLEAAGESLEEEIRRKEALLREKLKKTEEELRRIQKEKEQAEENEKRELQRMVLPGRRVKGNTTYKPIFSPEFMSEEVFSRDTGEDETWGRSQERSSPFQFSDYGVQKLKRERLVASNNNIRDRVSGRSKETFSQASEAPLSALRRSTSNSNSSRAPHSSGSGCSTEELERGECSHCGRKFLLLRLERHSNVCRRMQSSKRKVFDSSRARAKGTELEQYLNWKEPAPVKAEPPWKSNWKQKHESFIRTLRQAREVQQIIAKGGNPSDLPPILPAENPDYIQCPHCSRHFAPKVAEWHIPKCKTIKNRPPPPRKHCS
ncbi:zinc finger C2HC domain-containing protein 1C [Tursiops truncatus]|uniref:Zinc finger C2HC domain-containing protein 1C n=1 Tax=Tursiops truncatus TaxID=9739 RepID=A0A2U3V4G2_TURTR|nr:zinc finger C2HC domain-containing protein 1C [Tursiops truncatus]XP_019776484.1 zinc finger C2HC domain-containing protein 1C [Tursiops truncatus]